MKEADESRDQSEKAMLEAEIWGIAQAGGGSMVFLRAVKPDMTVPIFIGQLEAQAILIGYDGHIDPPRPLTVDLMITLMRRMDLALLKVEISEIKNNTFFARLLFKGTGPASLYTEETPLVMDARPSDALALAVRSNCPLYIAEKVVEEAGISAADIIEADTDSLEGRRESLKTELDAAVAREDYEKAAELRDRLSALEKN